LFADALVAVKEGFVHKKFGFDLPENLHGGAIEALAFNRDILILVAKKMGVVLS